MSSLQSQYLLSVGLTKEYNIKSLEFSKDNSFYGSLESRKKNTAKITALFVFYTV